MDRNKNNNVKNIANVQKPNKEISISFWILTVIALSFAFFWVQEIVVSFNTGVLQNNVITYGIIVLLFAFFLFYFYRYFVKAYLIEEEDYFTIGNLKKENTVYYKDIDKVIQDIRYFIVYYNDTEKERVPLRTFSPQKLANYINANFNVVEEDAFKIVYVRK